MVADVANGFAETSVAGTTATLQRKEIVDFTFDIAQSESGLIIQTPSAAQVSHGNYFYEFDSLTWVVIGKDIFQYNFIQIMLTKLDCIAGGRSISKFTSLTLVNPPKYFHFL